MNQNCIFHPTQAANWSCPKCSALLCSECVVKNESGIFPPGEMQYLCPKCSAPAEWCGSRHNISPFWNRLPQIFAYPFSSFCSAAFIFATAILLVKSNNYLKLLTIFTVFIYASDVLKATAAGYPKPPRISIRSLFDNIGLAFILLCLCIAPMIILDHFKGDHLIIALYISILFLTPALIITLLTPRKLSLNPISFIRIVYKIRGSYLLMYLYIILFFLAHFDSWNYINRHLPTGLHKFIITLFLIHYTIIFFHLLGYVAFQCHDEIGHEVDNNFIKKQAMKKMNSHQADLIKRMMKITDPLILDGRYDEAIIRIKTRVRMEKITNLALSKRYYSLLKMMNYTEQMLEYGVIHLDLLVQHKQKHNALAIYSECRALEPDFLPSAAALFALGEWMTGQGKTGEATHHYHRLVNVYPENPIAPKAYFRLAQLLNDKMMNSPKAAEIIKNFLIKYPEHDIAPKVRCYLASMNKSGKSIEHQLKI